MCGPPPEPTMALGPHPSDPAHVSWGAHPWNRASSPCCCGQGTCMLQPVESTHGFALPQQEHFKISRLARANTFFSRLVRNFKILLASQKQIWFPCPRSSGQGNLCMLPPGGSIFNAPAGWNHTTSLPVAAQAGRGDPGVDSPGHTSQTAVYGVCGASFSS